LFCRRRILTSKLLNSISVRASVFTLCIVYTNFFHLSCAYSVSSAERHQALTSTVPLEREYFFARCCRRSSSNTLLLFEDAKDAAVDFAERTSSQIATTVVAAKLILPSCLSLSISDRIQRSIFHMSCPVATSQQANLRVLKKFRKLSLGIRNLIPQHRPLSCSRQSRYTSANLTELSPLFLLIPSSFRFCAYRLRQELAEALQD
jgi:hypothetical protein